MIVVIVICMLLGIGYAALMLLYRKGWQEQPTFVVDEDFTPITTLSIIIPARNEEASIGRCLDSIFAQDYPQHLIEVVVIDDHSTDATASIVKGYNEPNLKCLHLADYLNDETIAYKKKALTTGINNSIGELIVTTDADCFAGNQWLKHIAAIYEKEEPVMIVAPVDFTTNGDVVQTFQSLDFMSMQGITGAAHKLNLGNMSNGANLAFSRKAYLSVDGYKGIDHLASGDDYLLMMKLNAAWPSRIAYLKAEEAIVHTPPQPTWGSFLQQRIRWASKSGKYDDKRLTGILLLVYLFNFYFLVLLLLGFWNGWLWALALTLLVLKTEVEIYYLYPVSRFFHKRKQLWIFPLLQPLHILYIISAGFLGFVGVYKWKGRKVK
ncbi:MAG TPA: glycosyltransferase [Flavipsychrobacter sp.]